MRGVDALQQSLFTVAKPRNIVPEGYPLWPLQEMVNEALRRLNGYSLCSMRHETCLNSNAEAHACVAAASVLLGAKRHAERANTLQHAVWLICGLGEECRGLGPSTFSKHRDRLLDHAVVNAFFVPGMTLAHKLGLLSKENFSVNGTRKACASQKEGCAEGRF